METLQGFKRTNYCGELRLADAGREISVCGWVQRSRDLGSLIFTDLRDRTGILQLAFDDATEPELFKKAATLRSEYVIAARGVLRERSAKNAELPTGEVAERVGYRTYSNFHLTFKNVFGCTPGQYREQDP